MLIVGLFVGGERRYQQQQKLGLGRAKADLRPPNYQAFTVFAALRVLSLLSFVVLQHGVLPVSPHTAELLYLKVFWGTHLLSALCVFFVLEAMLRNALSGMTEVVKPAMAIYCWGAGVLVCLGMTAHLPALGQESMRTWLEDVRVSLLTCVSSAEVCLLMLLLTRRERLGLVLRSRAIGITFGFTVVGCADLLSAICTRVSPAGLVWVNRGTAAATLCMIVLWLYYIISPEPARLISGTVLLPWKAISERLGEKHRPASKKEAFISEVEVKVLAILAKHGILPVE